MMEPSLVCVDCEQTRIAAFRNLQQGLSVPRLPCEIGNERVGVCLGRLRRRFGYHRFADTNLMRGSRGADGGGKVEICAHNSW